MVTKPWCMEAAMPDSKKPSRQRGILSATTLD
jgi:hypothetical protein